MKTLIILLLCISIHLAQSDILPYQSHSFNDLDYITQQLIKGIIYFPDF